MLHKVKRRALYSLGLILGFVLTYVYRDSVPDTLKATLDIPKASADVPYSQGGYIAYELGPATDGGGPGGGR